MPVIDVTNVKIQLHENCILQSKTSETYFLWQQGNSLFFNAIHLIK